MDGSDNQEPTESGVKKSKKKFFVGAVFIAVFFIWSSEYFRDVVRTNTHGAFFFDHNAISDPPEEICEGQKHMVSQWCDLTPNKEKCEVKRQKLAECLKRQ